MKPMQESLDENTRLALLELSAEIRGHFAVHRIVLFGSFARGDWDEESDVDVLVITEEKLARGEKHRITDLTFSVNLEHDTNICSLVVDRASWEGGFFPLLALHREVEKEGVAV